MCSLYISVIDDNKSQTKDHFKKDYLKFLKWDIKEAQKGNVDSAYKSACDGVWRDIRQQFTKLFDNCDNLKILNYFLTNIMSIHNKLCDGPSVDSIIFIRKLIKEKKIELLRKSEFNFLKKGKEIYLNQKNKKIKINTIFYGLADLYKKDYPNEAFLVNLDNWQELEKKAHSMFSSMYQFWVKK